MDGLQSGIYPMSLALTGKMRLFVSLLQDFILTVHISAETAANVTGLKMAYDELSIQICSGNFAGKSTSYRLYPMQFSYVLAWINSWSSIREDDLPRTQRAHAYVPVNDRPYQATPNTLETLCLTLSHRLQMNKTMSSLAKNFTPFKKERSEEFSTQVKIHHKLVESVSTLVLNLLGK